jgi:hypothetical protein
MTAIAMHSVEFEFVLDENCNFEEQFTFEALNRSRIVAAAPCPAIDRTCWTD